MKCPLCHKQPIQTERGLRKHLTGALKYGGHELSDRSADDQIAVALGYRRPETIQQVVEPASRLLVASAESGLSVSHEVRPVGRAYLPHADPVIHPALTSPFLESVLSALVTFKTLPKFQFERRIDAFIAPFLPEILARLLGGDVVLVAPEFPIKKPDNNQSTNVDYVLYRRGVNRDGDRWLFFELKTDLGSVRAVQLDAYEHARRRGMKALLKDVESIRSASKEQAKYDALLRLFSDYPDTPPIEIVVLAPGKVAHAAVHLITFAELLEMELGCYPTEWHLFREAVIRKSLV